MNAIDILVLLAIGGCAVLGLMRGFVLETLSLIAWVLAIFAIRLFHASAAELLSAFVGSASGAAVLALVLVFGVTFGIGIYGSAARRPDWLSDARTFPLLNASGQAISEFLAEQRAKKPAAEDR
ncbi:CvpA family protein [Sphingobium sp. CCH11-B1]|uniref:CvpA family protein n=1 Tax=Sphingobium sp. CCH11-B1 TaxID=1768781 RepID=UPI000831909E|nr:CvpA family protein [Sphingobium sp. CCH11-B1]